MTEAPRDHEDLAPRPAQQNGVLVLNKPSGPTSNRCITAIKRMGQKKIGHAGTLDPMAGGVLLVLLGQGTKLSGYLLGGGAKIYRGTLELGRETDTWDKEGTVLAENGWDGVSGDAVRRDIASWTGSHMPLIPLPSTTAGLFTAWPAADRTSLKKQSVWKFHRRRFSPWNFRLSLFGSNAVPAPTYAPSPTAWGCDSGAEPCSRN